MARCVFYFKENEKFVNIEADEFHEDGEYLKAYFKNELVGIFLIDIVKCAYRTERKIENGNNEFI